MATWRIPIFCTPIMLLFLLVSTQHHSYCQAIPSEPHYFQHQLVDHTNSSRAFNSLEWTQRYYSSGRHFQGAGSPIFLILGGEGAIPPETGLFYPFVSNRLAQTFGAFVLQPEHRYYGESIPVQVIDDYDPRSSLLTPEQALYDAVRLTRHVQNVLQCSQDKSSVEYCPVISVGGSYPGFLSMAARLRFPQVVDMAYSASAPVQFYAQQVHSDEYYNHISRIAQQCQPGCASAVKSTLTLLAMKMQHLDTKQEIQQAAASLGFCPESIPEYMTKNGTTFQTELFMIVGYTFANDNMAYYPPDNTTRLYSSCRAFLDTTESPTNRVKRFFQQHFLQHNSTCINMTLQLPSGSRATLSAGDWSGVGTGGNGESWDFQTCTLLVEAIGYSPASMFPTRFWSREWLTRHCQSRFKVSPQPNLLAGKWHFDNLVETNMTRILFTNGLLDGWSVGGILTNISDSIVSLNFPNGAHHSDLSHDGPSERDTPDVCKGFDKIEQLLGEWLQEIRASAVSIQQEGGYKLRASR